MKNIDMNLKRQKTIVILLQFSVFFAIGSGAPFLSIYFKKILLNANGTPANYWIGLIFFFQSITGMISPLIAGYIADKFKIENRILTLCAVFVFLSGILLLIPGITVLSDLPLNSKLLFIIIGMTLNGLFIRPIVPLIDTETLVFLQNKEGKIDAYGKYRMFGTIGWIVSSCTLGAILFLTNTIIIAIICYSLLFLILAGISFSGIKSKIKTIKIPWKYLKSDTTMKLYLIFVLLFSVGFSSSLYFTGYFLDDNQVNYLIIGLVFGLPSILEIPVMYIGNRINKYLSLKSMIITGCIIQSAKFLLFYLIAYTSNKFLFIVINSIHGIGFGLYFYASIRFIDNLAHRNLRATYQNLFHFVFTIGASIGVLASPWIIESWDSRVLMLIDSLIIFASAVYLFFIPVKSEKKVV